MTVRKQQLQALRPLTRIGCRMVQPLTSWRTYLGYLVNCSPYEYSTKYCTYRDVDREVEKEARPGRGGARGQHPSFGCYNAITGSWLHTSVKSLILATRPAPARHCEVQVYAARDITPRAPGSPTAQVTYICRCPYAHCASPDVKHPAQRPANPLMTCRTPVGRWGVARSLQR